MANDTKRGETRRKGAAAKAAAKVCISLLLLLLLYRKVDFPALRNVRAGADLRWAAPFFAIAFFNMLLSSLRWRLFLEADGLRIPVAKLFASHWIASFCNFFLPSNVGGDVYRVADIGLRSGSLVRSTASVLMDRLCGFLAMSLLGFAFPLAWIGRVPREHAPWLLVPAAFFAVFAGAFLLLVRGQLFVRGVAARAPLSVRPRIVGATEKFLASVSAGGAKAGVVAKAIGISLVFQFLVFAAIAVTGRVLRFPVPFASPR